MKIRFTGISKTDAVSSLERAADEELRFADRIGAKPCFAAEADKAKARAKRFAELADLTRRSGDTVSMSEADENALRFALAKTVHTFEALDSLYTGACEADDAIPLDIALAEGAIEAQKYE